MRLHQGKLYQGDGDRADAKKGRDEDADGDKYCLVEARGEEWCGG